MNSRALTIKKAAFTGELILFWIPLILNSFAGLQWVSVVGNALMASATIFSSGKNYLKTFTS